MSNKLIEVKQERAAVMDQLRVLNELGKSRALTAAEQRNWDELELQAEGLTARIDRMEMRKGYEHVMPVLPDLREVPRNPYSRMPSRTSVASGPVSIDDVRIDPGEEREARRSFYHYLRTGDAAALSEVRAYNDTAMSVGTDAAGGYGVPVGLVQEIKARRDETMLAVKLGCELVEGVGTTINYAVDDEADVLFSSVNEAGNVLQDTPALNEVALTFVKYGKHQKISWELERDNDVQIERFIRNWLTRGWAGTHNSLLLTELEANGTAGLTLDGSEAIAAAEVPELVGKLLPEYQERAAWIMHPTTHAYLSGLSGNPFHFMPTPGGNVSNNGRSLWGFPLHLSSYATALAASAKSMIFGDFSYVAYRDGPLEVIVDPYSNAGTGQKTLWAWFSAVYAVTIAEAIQYASNPT